MGLFDFFKQEGINQGIEEYGSTAGAILLDVRIPQEYQEGHIPESKNIPLQQLNNIVSVVKIKISHYLYIVIQESGAVRQLVCYSTWNI